MFRIYLLVLVLIAITFSEIKLQVIEESSGCKVAIINNSIQEIPIYGYRLVAPDTSWDSISSDLDLYLSYYKDENYSDQYIHQVNFKEPHNAIIRPGDTIEIYYHFSNFFIPPYPITEISIWDGHQYPLISKSLLNYYHSANVNKLSTDDLDSVISTINYYNSNYRYVDLCGNGTGGLEDDFNGKTQILLPVSDQTFRMSMTDVTFSPENAGITYWMTMAMGQEFFNIDMQYMTALGMKETFAAVGPNDLYIDVSGTGVYGPFQIERPTAHSRMFAYRDLFPEVKDMINGYYSATNYLTDNSSLINMYFNDTEFPLSSPEVVSAYIFSVACNLFIDESFKNCTEFDWDSLITNSSDTLLRVNAILASYNLGLFGGAVPIAEKVRDNYSYYLTNSDASDQFPQGNSNYRSDIMVGIKHLENISRQSNSDMSIEIYDEMITLNDIQKFLFGDGGTSTNPSATGGLYKHFEFDKERVWADVKLAFNSLKGNAPSTNVTEVISFRYDYLTILRIIASHLKIDTKFYGEADALMFADQFSTNFETKDLIPPVIKYDYHTYYNSRSCEVYCRLYDNNGILNLNYSDTSNWQKIVTIDDPWYSPQPEAFFSVKFSEMISPDNPAWFFSTDIDGNGSMSKTECANTSIIGNKKSSNKLILTHSHGMLSLKVDDFIKNSVISLKNIKGQNIRIIKHSGEADIRISTNNLSNGIYFINLNDEKINQTFKFHILK